MSAIHDWSDENGNPVNLRDALAGEVAEARAAHSEAEFVRRLRARRVRVRPRFREGEELPHDYAVSYAHQPGIRVWVTAEALGPSASLADLRKQWPTPLPPTTRSASRAWHEADSKKG